MTVIPNTETLDSTMHVLWTLGEAASWGWSQRESQDELKLGRSKLLSRTSDKGDLRGPCGTVSPKPATL